MGMDEEWRPVVGYESLYAVSNLGRVKRTGKARGTRLGVLKPGKHPKGYLFVGLTANSRKRVREVHRLVGEAFIGPLPPGLQTRHLDGNPANNAVTNLAYGTQSENMQDSIRHGTHPMARKTHCLRGHEYTPENTKPARGGRACRECHRIKERERLRAKRAAAKAAAA